MANTPNMPAPPAPGGFPPPGGAPVQPMSYGAPMNDGNGSTLPPPPAPAQAIPNKTTPAPQPASAPIAAPAPAAPTSPVAPRLSSASQGFSQPAVAYGSTSKTPPPATNVQGGINPGLSGMAEAEVHTMPEKFLPVQNAKPKMGSVKKFALVGGIIVVVMMVITAVVVLIFSRQPGSLSNQNVIVSNSNNVNRANTNVGSNTNVNANLNTNAVVNTNQANVNAVVNDNSNLNSNENLNTNTNVNFNTNTNTNINNNSAGAITSTKDTDKDGLTDNEEVIWGAAQNKPDTDGDGFLDGEEITSGYSPTSSSKLVDDPNAKTYANTSYQYSILYPARWVQGQLDDSDEDILLTAETGEFVEVTVTSNPQQQTAKEWYLEQFPELRGKDLDIFETDSGLVGVKSQNKLTGYLATSTTIYVITYNIGTRSAANFLTTFDMMLKTFQVTVE